ncbi:MAG: hypothetical protein IBX55_17695 [Methyloprofundus sp.]|nr:hypothetical protein [Methyloprofundus sp.]
MQKLFYIFFLFFVYSARLLAFQSQLDAYLACVDYESNEFGVYFLGCEIGNSNDTWTTYYGRFSWTGDNPAWASRPYSFPTSTACPPETPFDPATGQCIIPCPKNTYEEPKGSGICLDICYPKLLRKQQYPALSTDLNHIFPAELCIENCIVQKSSTSATSSSVSRLAGLGYSGQVYDYNGLTCGNQPAPPQYPLETTPQICPDGKIILTSQNETCELPKLCPDGSMTFGSISCPDPQTFICPNGEKVETIENCPDPTKETKTCTNGAVVPVTGVCPDSTTKICKDGSTIDIAAICPIDPDQDPYKPNDLNYQCYNGQIVQDPSLCPDYVAPPAPPAPVSTVTTTITPDGDVTTTVDIDLNGVNSRLDRVNQNLTDGNKIAGDILAKLSEVEGQGDPCDPESAVCGAPNNGEYVDKYTPTTSTYQSVISDFSSSVSNSALISSATAFFDVSVGGSCPVWSVNVMGMDIVIDQQCSSVMASIFPIISAVLMALSGFVAFRWAFL